MTTNEHTKRGVAIFGTPQRTYDLILKEHLLPGEDVDTGIPAPQRSTIQEGFKNFAEHSDSVESGSPEYEKDLYYLNRIFDEIAIAKFNIDEADLKGARPVNFPLISYLENPGIRAFIMNDGVRLHTPTSVDGSLITGNHVMILVYDTPFPEDEVSSSTN